MMASETGTIFVVSEYSQPGMPNQAMYSFAVSIDKKRIRATLGEVALLEEVDPGQFSYPEIGIAILGRLFAEWEPSDADVESLFRLTESVLGGDGGFEPAGAASPNAARLAAEIAGEDEPGLSGVVKEPQDLIDAGNQMFNDVVQPGLPPGTPYAVTHASWGDPILMLACAAAAVGMKRGCPSG